MFDTHCDIRLTLSICTCVDSCQQKYWTRHRHCRSHHELTSNLCCNKEGADGEKQRHRQASLLKDAILLLSNDALHSHLQEACNFVRSQPRFAVRMHIITPLQIGRLDYQARQHTPSALVCMWATCKVTKPAFNH